MAVTTKKLFPATSNATTTVFSPVGIQLNNQDDLDVYVTLSGGTRVLQLRQSTGSTAQSSHPQVNNTDGLYFPAVTAGTTLYNYTLSTDNNTITFNSALPQGAVVFCERRTRDADSSYTSFASGSTIRATDLNNSSTESNFTAQDGRNKALTIEGVLFRGDQPSTNFVTTDHIVAGTIVTNDIANDSVTADKIPDDTINSEHYVDGSIDTQHIANLNITTAKIAADAVNTTKIADLNVTRAKIANDAIDGTKLADNAVDSEHYVDGSIDHVHLANDIIDGDNIQDDVINSEHIAAGALDNEHYAAGSITSDKLNGATVITASEQGSATTNDTSFLTSAAADARFFNISSGDTIKDGDTFPDNDTTIATTAAINDRIIDLVEEVGGFVPIANETSFPTANPDINNGSGTLVSIQSISSTRTPSSGTVTIANGAGSGNTVSITGCGSTVLSAGFGVIVETTSTLHTYAFHRLVPKATEVTTVAGISGNVTTVAGIAANTTTVAGISSDVTTVAGISSNVTSVANNASNINSAVSNASNINSAVSNASNITTVAGSISNVNTVAGSISSVNTAASNLTSINNFGDTYQVAANNPSTDGGGNALAEGDLYFNTSANRLKVFDGSSWVNGVEISGSGAVTTGNTFTGDNKYNDNVKALFGTGSDLEIFHNGNHSKIINKTGNLTLNSAATTGAVNIIGSTGQVELYYGGSEKLETTNSGVNVSGNITVSGNVDGRDLAADGTKLDGIEASATADGGSNGTDYNDNVKIRLGASQDLQLYHASNQSLIQDSIGDLRLCSNDIRFRNGANSATSFYVDHDGETALYHNGTIKFETVADGVRAVNTGADAEIRALAPTGYNGRIEITADAGASHEDNYRLTVNTDQVFRIYGKPSGTYTSYLEIHSDGKVRLPRDNQKLQIGASQDLEIYHDGSNSHIDDSGTGALRLRTSQLSIRRYDNNEEMITASSGGAVELYNNGNKKFETYASGARIPNDGGIFAFGANNDIQIQHDGSNSYILNSTGHLYIQNDGSSTTEKIILQAKGGEQSLIAIPNAGVELYYDNSKKLETASNGGTLTGDWSVTSDFFLNDNGELTLGTGGDFKLFHNGQDSFIRNSTGVLKIQTGTENAITATLNGAVNLYYDNSSKLQTTTNGINVDGRVVCDRADVDGQANISYPNGTNTNFIASLSNNNGIMHLFRGDALYIGNNMNTSNQGSGPNNKALSLKTNGDIVGTGNFTANAFYGDGSNLTGISSTTINSNVNNYLITGTGTAGTLQGEAGLTFNGQTLQVTDTTNGARLHLRGQSPQVFFDCTSGGNGSVYLDGHSFRIFPNQPSSPGNERVFIKSNGNIGINETNPQQLLHVHNDTSYQGMLLNGNGAPRVAFARNTTTTGEWSVGIDGTNGNNFVINNSNDNSATKLLLTSSGVGLVGTVTQSSQPCFHAYNSGSSFSWNNGTIPFNAELFDVGSNYNTSNYRFTVPTAGKYLFIAVFRAGGGFGEFSWLLQKNGTTVNRVVAQGSFAGNDMQHGTVIVNAAVNDYFTIYGTGSHGGATGGSGRSSFFGYLLG